MISICRTALVAALCLIGMRITAGAEQRSLNAEIERLAEKYAYSKWPAPPAGLFSSLDFDDLWKVLGDRGFVVQKERTGGGSRTFYWTTAGEPKVTGTISLGMFDSVAGARRSLLGATTLTAPLKEVLYQDPPVGEVLARPLSNPNRSLLFLRRNVLVHLYIQRPRDLYASWVEDVDRTRKDLTRTVDSYLKQLEAVEVEKLGYDFELSGLEGPFKVGEPFVIKSVARRPKQGSDEGKAAQDGYRLLLSLPSMPAHHEVSRGVERIDASSFAEVERIDASSFCCTVANPGKYFVYATGTWDDYICTGTRQEAVITVEKNE